MTGFKRGYLPGILCLLAIHSSIAVNNPIQAPVSGSMIRHNGHYYAMSQAGDGHMLQSDNLIDWTNTVQVIPSGITGPFDLTVRNGLVHLFAADAGYAYSEAPDIPFSKFHKRGHERLDTRLFQDKSGELLCVMREMEDRNISKVKESGDISIQRFTAPWKPYGTPRTLLKARRGMWDTLDGTGFGMPDLFDYRGNYYLLYSGNLSDPRIGLRGIGVAVNEKPLEIENEYIQPDVVLRGNSDRLVRAYRTVLPVAAYMGWEGVYTFEAPDKGWTLPGFKPAGWRTGKGGFGAPDKVGPIQLSEVRSRWNKPHIWVRRSFGGISGVMETPVLQIRHGGAVRVYLNGIKVYEAIHPSPSYRNIALPDKVLERIRPQENVLAVHAVANPVDGYQLLDFGLYDAGDHPVEPVVSGAGAPRIVTGPNGFEKWMAYDAYWNSQPGTGLDRVFFHDYEMIVDGPTTANTPGYHPGPSLPTFSDSFERSTGWRFASGKWNVTAGVLVQEEGKKTAKAYLEQKPAKNYLFAADIRMSPSEKGRVGLVAWSNGKNDLVVWLNPAEHTWGYHVGPGRVGAKSFSLPEKFRFVERPEDKKDSSLPWHRLRITKNGGHFNVMLDKISLTAKKPIMTKFSGAGVPGLFCQYGHAAFDGVTYTVGWDEYGKYITGWGSAIDGTPASGKWNQDKKTGLEQKKKSESGMAFKGDLLDQYEFAVTARTEKLEDDDDCHYGVFPIFIDQNNYLKAMLDLGKRKLVVSGRRKGTAVGPYIASLARTFSVQDMYGDTSEWVYRLPSHSIISGLQVRWQEGRYDHLQEQYYIPADEIVVGCGNVRAKRDFSIEKLEVESPNVASILKSFEQKEGILNRIDIREEEGNYMVMDAYSGGSITNSVFDLVTGELLDWLLPDFIFDPEKHGVAMEEIGSSSDISSRPQETLVNVELESSYFFRCVKLKDRVMIELNGKPMLTVEGDWPASQVGLVTEGQPCFYNGITLMHLPSE